MRTKRDEVLDRLADASSGIDAALADVRATAREALRNPLERDSAMRLLSAAILLPLMGIAATMTDAAPELVRRSRNPELDEPASTD
jgi:hypothetical protein